MCIDCNSTSLLYILISYVIEGVETCQRSVDLCTLLWTAEAETFSSFCNTYSPLPVYIKHSVSCGNLFSAAEEVLHKSH